MKRILYIDLPVKAMSINHYQQSTRNGIRYTTDKGKTYVNTINIMLPSKDRLAYHPDVFPYFKLEIIAFSRDMFTKKGTVSSRSTDVDNVVKILQDCIFKKYNLNDKLVVDVRAFKKHDIKEDHTIVKLYGLTEDDFKNLTKEVENDD